MGYNLFWPHVEAPTVSPSHEILSFSSKRWLTLGIALLYIDKSSSRGGYGPNLADYGELGSALLCVF